MAGWQCRRAGRTNWEVLTEAQVGSDLGWKIAIKTTRREQSQACVLKMETVNLKTGLTKKPVLRAKAFCVPAPGWNNDMKSICLPTSFSGSGELSAGP